MRKANLNVLQPLLLGFALIAATPLAPLWAEPTEYNDVWDIEVQKNPTETTNAKGSATAPTNAALSPKDSRIIKLESSVAELTKNQKASGKEGPLGVAWPLWLAGGSSLLSLIALMMARGASSSRRGQQAEIQSLSKDIKKLKGNNQSLLIRIGGLEAEKEQERVMNWGKSMAVPPQVSAPLQAQPSPAIPSSVPLSVLAPQPAQALGPAPLSKDSLINALNAGDRQPLRNAAIAELNITSESENALAMGRAVATELEKVPGGGSYCLVTHHGQYWLFPTDRTLKGFSATQPVKGLFLYEKQTIAQPQLLEPALLESNGTLWRVTKMGLIAHP